MPESSARRSLGLLRGWPDVVEFIQSVKARGLWHGLKQTASALRYRYQLSVSRAFESKYGVNAGGIRHLSEFSIHGQNKELGNYYEPTSVGAFRCLMSSLPSDLDDFVFVDFGSGMGIAVLLAAERRFKRVVGVEFAEELHEDALEHAARFKSRRRKCPEIEFLCMDAAVFEIPDDTCVFYFYNPFERELMSTVLGNIERSYRENPRKMYFVYLFPVKGRCTHTVALDLFEGLEFAKRMTINRLRLRFWLRPYLGAAVFET